MKRRVRRKNKVKKRISKKKKATEQSVLSDALGDISRELTKLKRDKLSLSNRLGKLETEILTVQNYEVKLRDRITQLVSKESQLNRSKGISQAKLLKIREKIAKIKKIQEELREI